MQIKRLIQFSTILSWFNLIISGMFTAGALLVGSFMLGFGNVLMVVVLMGSITLHSYAALQLRKSLLNPAVPLARQTSTGIRFIGYIALFLAFMFGSSSIYTLQHAKEIMDQMQFPPELKNIDMTGAFKKSGIFMLVFSISVLLNVILNLRFYRLYQLMHQRSDEPGNGS